MGRFIGLALTASWLASAVAAVAAEPASAHGPSTRPASSGRQVAKVQGTVDALALSPDGKRLAVGLREKKVLVHDVATGAAVAVLTYDNSTCEALKFSDDGRTLYAMTWNGLFGDVKRPYVWRLADGKSLLEPDPALGDDDPLPRAFFGDLSPDGRTVALSGPFFPCVYVIDLATARHRYALADVPLVQDVFFSRDAKSILAAHGDYGGQPTVGIYGLGAGRPSCATRLPNDLRLVGATDFASQRVLTLREDRSVGWLSLATGEWQASAAISEEEGRNRLAATPDGRLLASTSADTVRVIDLTGGREPVTVSIRPSGEVAWGEERNFGVHGFTLADDGSCLATAWADGTIRVLSLPAAQPATTRPGTTRPAGGGLAHPETTKPVKILFEGDVQADPDAAAALSLLHALADRGEAEILATVASAPGPWSVACIDAINIYHGRPDIALGGVDGEIADPSPYGKRMAGAFPRAAKGEVRVPDAVDVYRRVLIAQPNGSVIVVTAGPLTNLARLVGEWAGDREPADNALVRQKVGLWVCAGGNIVGAPAEAGAGTGSRHFARDLVSARTAIEHWPTPAVFVGQDALAVSAEMDVATLFQKLPPASPLRLSYGSAEGDKRHVEDLTAVLFAVRGHADHWPNGRRGRAHLNSDKAFEWEESVVGSQSLLPHAKDAAGKQADRAVEQTLAELLTKGAGAKGR